MLTKELKRAGFEIVEEIRGGSGFHLTNDKHSPLLSLRIAYGYSMFTFVENPSGCGTLIMGGNTNLSGITIEKWNELCSILASVDAGTIFAVLGYSIREEYEEEMFKYGFVKIHTYPNLRHASKEQYLYAKTTL